MTKPFCSIRQPLALGLIAVLVACGEASHIVDPSSGGPDNPGGDPGKVPVATGDMRVAITENAGAAHVLFVGRLDGALRNQLHFTNVADSIPGNLPILPVTDGKLISVAAPSLSPDGARLAAVVTVAPQQSEVIVMNADGTGAQVASYNLQIVTSIPTWSPDGSKLAYAMSTELDTAGLDLVVTDLKTHTITRLTTNADVKATAVRWSADGKFIYYARHTGTSSDGLNNWISEVVKVDAASGARQTIASNISGDISSISPSTSRVLLTRTVTSGAATTAELVEQTLGGSERVVVATDAASARYVSGVDDLAVVVTNVVAGGHATKQTVVMNVQTKASLSVVGADANTSIDAFYPVPRP